MIVEELEKQYDVVPVNADSPIIDRFDVLLAVQPSSLTEEQMHNFVAAVRSGQPTAIFEDPFPYLDPNVPATSAPKRPQGQMAMFQQTPPQPKGNIGELLVAVRCRFLRFISRLAGVQSISEDQCISAGVCVRR